MTNATSNVTKDPVLYAAHEGNVFDHVHNAHVTLGHAGRDLMLNHIRKKFCNISRTVVMLYLKLCRICAMKRKGVAKKNIVIRPIISRNFLQRGQLDLIDYQTRSDGEYRWILVFIVYMQHSNHKFDIN